MAAKRVMWSTAHDAGFANIHDDGDGDHEDEMCDGSHRLDSGGINKATSKRIRVHSKVLGVMVLNLSRPH